MRPTPQLAIVFLIAFAPVVHSQVGKPWEFKRQPHSQQVYLGHAVRLIGGSSDPLSFFRWLKFGQPVPDQLGPELKFLNVLPGDAGPYQLLAWNAANDPGISTIWESASEPARLAVIVPPASPGVVDWEFGDAGFGKGEVRALAADARGGLLVGGDFTSVGNREAGHIARLSVDGSPDPAFIIEPGADDRVRAVVAHRDGWVVGGDFKNFHNSARGRLARLLPNGALDPSFRAPSLTGNVRALAIQKVRGEDRVLVGMSAAPWLMRLQQNGSEDLEFSAIVGAAGLNGKVTCLTVQADGAVVLAGSFFKTATWPFLRLGRLLADGRADRAGFFWNASNSGPNGEVSALALDAQGRLVVGGVFTSIHGIGIEHLARLNVDGSVDPRFFSPAPNDPVDALAVLSTGEIAAAGRFTKVNGTTSPAVALLQPNGQLVQGWQAASFNDDGSCLAVGLADRLFVGGGFSQPHAGVVALRTREFDSPPQILSPPTPQELTQGMTGVISIAVESHPATTYHWHRTGQPGNTTITSTAEWIIPRVAATDAGAYQVEIISPFGRVTAGPIDIRVLSRPVGARPHQLGLPPKLPLDAPNFGTLNIPILMAACEVEDVRVTLVIDHEDTNDLTLTLIAPGGKFVRLIDPEFPTRLRRGKDFRFTVLADQADVRINDAGSPYVGTFGPSELAPGFAKLRGSYAAGQWTIEVRDDGEDGDIARIRFVSIDLFGPAKAIDSDAMGKHALPDGQPELQWHSDTNVVRLHHWQPNNAPTPVYESAETLTSWQPFLKTAVLRHRREYDQTATTELRLPAARVQPHAFFRASWSNP